jgi:hypothetical protein
MEISKKTLVVGVFAMLLLGIVLVGASSYSSIYDSHKRAVSSDDFEAMHYAMMNGDFATAEKYHEAAGFDCPMHDAVKNGDVSTEEFQMMHEWMVSGNFPSEKPEGFSESLWELHKSHHPEIYN